MGLSGSGVCERKKALRLAMRRVLQGMSDVRRDLDEALIGQLSDVLSKIGSVDSMAAYMAIQREPDLLPLVEASLASGRAVFLPRFDSVMNAYEMVQIHDVHSDLSVGRYGILEPVISLDSVSFSSHSSSGMVWLIPGLAFDAQGHRLGRGGGYYDHLLEGAGGVKVGVGYDCQLVEAVPSEVHDIRMDYVVTESRVLSVLN